MKPSIKLLFASSLLFISCKKELEPQESSAPANIVPFTEAANAQQNQTVMPTQTPQNTNNANQNTTPVAVAKGMNPAHGQPGHRCDIAVGAPLNSAAVTPKSTPAAAVSQQNSTPTTTVTTPAPAVTTPTPEGMNPPHGQDKHRCDIAVGAPLPKE